MRHCILCWSAQVFCLDVALLPAALPGSAALAALQRAVSAPDLQPAPGWINRRQLRGAKASRSHRGALLPARPEAQFGEWHPPRALRCSASTSTSSLDARYATTLCDLSNHRSTMSCWRRRPLWRPISSAWKQVGSARGMQICQRLSRSGPQALPNARIVADRSMSSASSITISWPAGAIWIRRAARTAVCSPSCAAIVTTSARAAVPLGRYLQQHPALETIYRFKQRLCYLLLNKHRTRKECEQLAPASCAPSASCGRRPAATGPTRPDPALLAERNRRHVALHPQQRHHRRLPNQNGTHQPAGPTASGTSTTTECA